MTQLKRLLIAVAWTLPFLISGLSAPFIFRHAPNHQVGGHYAGALFMTAAVYALAVSIRHKFHPTVIGYVLFFGILAVAFWVWRFQNDLPLDQAVFLFARADVWHMTLTFLYLTVAGVLVTCEYRRAVLR